MGQRPYGLHPGHRHVPPRFPLREIGGTDMGTLAINKGRHSAKAGNWRRAKRARISSIFSSRHPSPPTNRNGGRGNTVRHDYCAIPPPIESGVWVILATRNSETYARSWAS